MKSIWSRTCELPHREPLSGDLVVETAVVGAGMAGLLTAFLLQQEGKEVIVLEAGETAGGVTKNTTAKITSQHGLTYDRLIRSFGIEAAAQYALINQRAVRKYRELIREHGIDCDFEEKPAYLYTLEDEAPLRSETEAAKRLGLKAEFTADTELPFPVKGAVRFEDQAQFHPLKFLKAISADLNICEHTMVRERRDSVLITDTGRVTADHIVVATHFPFINVPGWYFARMHQERSYVLALENAPLPDGMYLGVDRNGYSFRSCGDLLLFGGAGHRTGCFPAESCYGSLRRAAEKYYPESREALHWSAQDCVTWDEVPYIGRYAASTDNLYVATGFRKWGMTSSMAAAIILTDLICGRQNDCAPVFSPQRFLPGASAKNLLTDGAHSVAGLAAGLFSGPGRRCTHLGCRLKWNPDENSWDCPCHGSRFTEDGALIGSPALKGLSHEPDISHS